MSQDTPSSSGLAIPPVTPATPAKHDDQPESVYLVSYPKIMFLYPTVLVALLCGIFMWFKGGLPKEEVLAALLEPATSNVLQASLAMQDAPTATAGATDPAPGQGTEAPTANTPSADSPTATNPPAVDDADSSPTASVPTFHVVCARIFLLVLTLNLVVIAFDFPRTTSLTWFFALVALSIGLWFMFNTFPHLAPGILYGLGVVKPAANTAFYFIFACAMLFLFICVLVSRRFDYWEVKGNELLHHHGFLSNMERFSAPNLRIDKEINDLFEYMLLRSGRLIIHASNERRAIVLENVMGINQKEERITKMLGALQVRVRTENS